MDISRLMVFGKQIEESILKKEKKISRMDNEVYDRHGHSMKREKYSGQVYSNAPRYEYKKMSNPKPQGKSNEYSHPTYPRCGKIHEGRCLAGRDGCYGCGESGHMKKDFPEAKANMREGN